MDAPELLKEFWKEFQTIAEKVDNGEVDKDTLKKTYHFGYKLVPPNVMCLVERIQNLQRFYTAVLAQEKEEENPFKHLHNPKTQKRIPDPTAKTLEAHPYRDYFKMARIRERNENLGWKTYVEILRSMVPPGHKILRTVTDYKTKYNSRGEIEKFKTRVCVDGSRITLSVKETYEQIASFRYIRLMLCMACRFKMFVAVSDVKNFFLQARLPDHKEYYVEIPDGWAENDPKTHVAKVLAPWYGLPEAAKLSGDQLEAVLIKNGLKANPWLPKTFFKWDGDDLIMCGTHIDDQPWVSSSKEKLEKLLADIDKDFKLQIDWKPDKILGCNLDYDREKGIMKLHQGSYNREKFMTTFKTIRGAIDSPGWIPNVLPNPDAESNQKDAPQTSVQEQREYMKVTGALHWANHTDPSTSYQTAHCSKFQLNPDHNAWKKLRRLEQYRAVHPEMAPVWRAADPPEKLRKGMSMDCLTGYADSDHGACLKTGKSYSGYCFHLGNSGLFDWVAKQQTVVAQSSCEAESICNKEATQDVIMYRNGLEFMGFTFSKPTPICQDNSSAISLCESSKHHSRCRHFRLTLFLLKDCYEKRITWYPWVPTDYMKGDLFNKTHGPGRHRELCEQNDISDKPLTCLPVKGKQFELDKWLTEVREKVAKIKADKEATLKSRTTLKQMFFDVRKASDPEFQVNLRQHVVKLYHFNVQ